MSKEATNFKKCCRFASHAVGLRTPAVLKVVILISARPVLFWIKELVLPPRPFAGEVCCWCLHGLKPLHFDGSSGKSTVCHGFVLPFDEVLVC